MPAPPDISRPRSRRPETPVPLRRSRAAALPRAASPLWRRALNYLLIFATVVLVVDALVGERGLVASRRARQQSDELTGQLERLQRENARLRETARRLKEDPGAIESVARETLGLIRPGEVLVVVKDVKGAKKK
jgi:cell division protein FtsB